MSSVAIPAWNSLGLLPPVDPSALPTSRARSPYTVALGDLVTHFSTSLTRRQILRGFLQYRATLHAYGFTEGFQWIDGSFAEDIETIEQREPNDIDVVTFLRTDNATSEPEQLMRIADNQFLKDNFKVDGYYVELSILDPRLLVDIASYWYSVWSHRRNSIWKGFLRVDLAPSNEGQVLAWLDSQESEEST